MCGEGKCLTIQIQGKIFDGLFLLSQFLFTDDFDGCEER